MSNATYEFDKLLDSASKKASKSIKKIAKKARKLGFKEGLSTADDYINTIIFKENAQYPLCSEELDEIFGTDDSFKILSKYNMDHIMEAIKRYKNNKETDTDE